MGASGKPSLLVSVMALDRKEWRMVLKRSYRLLDLMVSVKILMVTSTCLTLAKFLICDPRTLLRQGASLTSSH